ncbi:hypothetical protein NFI90_01800, partial [Mesomycoplasma ovipneumoniae]
MNILYDKKKKEYILGNTKFTKDEFVEYIENDMLEAALSNEDISLEMDKQSQNKENKKDMEDVFLTSYNSLIPRNRIIFGAPGTGKSYTLNNDLQQLLGENNEDQYERVTFHPDYLYANFVGTYKPVMVDDSFENLTETDKYIVSVLWDRTKSAQEKYDLLYDKFKDGRINRLPCLVGLYTDGQFTARKVDGTPAADNSTLRSLGKGMRQYVNLYKPESRKKDISYQYVPGPFMRVLVKALKNAMTGNPRPFVLLIEEINRANVAAVFGDIFQLLDRDSDGVSEYKIATTNDMRRYLSEQLGVQESKLESIKIPNNMFIWA